MLRKLREWKRQEKRREFESITEVRAYVRSVIRKYLEGEVPPGTPRKQREKYRIQVQNLRQALRACVYGEGGEKAYVKYVIMRILTEAELSGREKSKLLPLYNPERLTPKQKFDVMLYRYMKEYGRDGFLRLCEAWDLPGEIEREDGKYYEITAEDVCRIFDGEKIALSDRAVMEVICDEVYEGFGHGIIDRLRDCRLEGISGGVSGVPDQFFRYEGELEENLQGNRAYDSVFVMLRGNTIRLSFLSFGSESELRRVTKALLRYKALGELSYYNPYLVNDMKDGSRVFACRPPFSESWAFFVRKFDSIEEKKPEDLITGEGAEMIIQALRYLVGGGLHVAITGAQGSGKTTLLKALVRYINPKYNLRIEESVFELWMRKEFPYRNILTFRETESVSSTEGLDAFRKTDGNCLMMGEVGNIDAAALMIELSQVSEQQLFTHHAMTTEKLLGYFRNALLRTGMYSDECMAQAQVEAAFDIHILCEKDLTGRRYVKEITEIEKDGGSKTVLFRYTENGYVKGEVLSEHLLNRITEHQEEKKKQEIRKFFGEV